MAEYAKTAAVKGAIIAACSGAFADTGFRGATMAEIARRANVSYTGLLHHFPRKEDLLAAVLRLQDERSADYLRAHNGAVDVDPLAVLRGMIASVMEMDRERGLAELAATLLGEATAPAHPAHQHFSKRYLTIRKFMTRLFTRLEGEGRLAPGADPAALAAIIIAVSEGLRTQWLFDAGDELRVDDLISTVLSSFVPEIAASSGGDI